MTTPREVKPALSVAASAQRPEDLPAALASRVLLELGLKPVIREMHDTETAPEAVERWRRAGMAAVVGEAVLEHTATAAQAIDAGSETLTVRPLETHPLVERALQIGGLRIERLLLDPESRVSQWLRDRLGADQLPSRLVPSGGAGEARSRCAVYVSQTVSLAEEARDADAMGKGQEDAVAMGRLLGYPRCCVEAFTALPVRYPNRVPISAAAGRTRRFEPLLNNLSLRRFTFIAHFPCRFDCAESLAQAERVRAAMSAANSEVTREVVRLLGMPRVYASDEAQAVLEGASRKRDRLSYARLMDLQTAWPARNGNASNWSRLGPDADGTVRMATEGDVLVLPFGL